jgi:hypothetical protein
VTCEAPFARDTSHKKLVAAFGASNVGDEKRGRLIKYAVLYPRDPARRLKIEWRDPKHRNGAVEIVIDGKSRWSAGGLRLGMSIQEVEALNGEGFTLYDLNDRSFPGAVRVWFGALERFGERFRDPCDLSATFAAEASRGRLQKLQEDTVLSSDDPTLRSLGPKLVRITVSYQWENADERCVGRRALDNSGVPRD